MGSGEGFTVRNFHILYHSFNIVRVIKSRRLKWAGHVVRMVESGRTLKMLTGRPTSKKIWTYMWRQQ
jgi:hypothetical protein